MRNIRKLIWHRHIVYTQNSNIPLNYDKYNYFIFEPKRTYLIMVQKTQKAEKKINQSEYKSYKILLWYPSVIDEYDCHNSIIFLLVHIKIIRYVNSTCKNIKIF